MNAIGSDLYRDGTLVARCASEADAQHLARSYAIGYDDGLRAAHQQRDREEQKRIERRLAQRESLRAADLIERRSA